MAATWRVNREYEGIEISFDGKPSEEIRNKMKSVGFKWSSAQMKWYAKDNDRTRKVASEIATQDEDVGEYLTFEQKMERDKERAERRQERLGVKAGKLEQKSEALLEQAHKMAAVIPFGQPILVGHHSEGRDRRYRGRIHDKFGKAFETQDEAKDVKLRLEGSEALSRKRETPGYMSRKIDQLEAELRKFEREKKYWETNLPDWEKKTNDLKEQIAYWKKELGEAGGLKVTPDDVKAGDEIRYMGTWYEVVRVNPKTVTIKNWLNVPTMTWGAEYSNIKEVRHKEPKEEVEGPEESKEVPTRESTIVKKQVEALGVKVLRAKIDGYNPDLIRLTVPTETPPIAGEVRRELARGFNGLPIPTKTWVWFPKPVFGAPLGKTVVPYPTQKKPALTPDTSSKDYKAGYNLAIQGRIAPAVPAWTDQGKADFAQGYKDGQKDKIREENEELLAKEKADQGRLADIEMGDRTAYEYELNQLSHHLHKEIDKVNSAILSVGKDDRNYHERYVIALGKMRDFVRRYAPKEVPVFGLTQDTKKVIEEFGKPVPKEPEKPEPKPQNIPVPSQKKTIAEYITKLCKQSPMSHTDILKLVKSIPPPDIEVAIKIIKECPSDKLDEFDRLEIETLLQEKAAGITPPKQLTERELHKLLSPAAKPREKPETKIRTMGDVLGKREKEEGEVPHRRRKEEEEYTRKEARITEMAGTARADTAHDVAEQLKSHLSEIIQYGLREYIRKNNIDIPVNNILLAMLAEELISIWFTKVREPANVREAIGQAIVKREGVMLLASGIEYIKDSNTMRQMYELAKAGNRDVPDFDVVVKDVANTILRVK